MSEPRTCPVCGASNPAGADWCGQCFARFDEPQKAMVSEMASGVKSPHAVATTHTAAAPAWTCELCETENSMDHDECVTCGASMFDTFGDRDIAVDPGQAALWSLVPGLGLAKAGQGLLGLSAGLLIGMALAAGALFLSSGSTAIGVVLTLTGIGVWAISAHDAYRFALGDAKGTFLRPRVLTVIAGGVLGLMALALVLASGRVGR